MKEQEGITDFQRAVYEATRKIPRGKVTTYRHIAKHIGCGSSQAVGQALRRNPFAPKVPCHRVIRTDLTLGGFSGQVDGPAIKRKLALLEQEGVQFVEYRLADPGRVFRFKRPPSTSG